MPRKTKAPVRGLREYLYESLNEVIHPKDPNHWEIGDEIIDGLDTPQRHVFADLVNQVATKLELIPPNHVRRSKAEFKEAGDWTVDQRNEFVLVLNHICEKIREEPGLIHRLPHFGEYEAWFRNQSHEIELEAIEDSFEEATAGVSLSEVPVVPLSASEQELLNDSELLEKLVSYGESLVRDVADVWRAFYLASASSYAPPILYNGSEQRAQIHIFLLGDPSTAKSRMLKEFEKLNPKCRIANDITFAGFVGTVAKGVPMKGEAAELDRGVLCIDEFEKFYKNHYRNIDGVLRAVMEDSHIRRRLALGTVDDDTRTCIIASANPKNDMFVDASLKEQMPVPYGLLSRFDYFRPLAYTQHKIAEIGKFMASIAFKVSRNEEGYLNHDKVRRILIELRKAWESSRATRVEISDDLLKKVESAWELHLDKWDARNSKGVPLLTNRDLASLFRFLNASAVLHICQRDVVDGAVIAVEADTDNAIWILDQLALWRREYLMTEGKRARIAECNTERVQRIIDQHQPKTTMDIARALMARYDISERTAQYWIADYRRATGQSESTNNGEKSDSSTIVQS